MFGIIGDNSCASYVKMVILLSNCRTCRILQISSRSDNTQQQFEVYK